MDEAEGKGTFTNDVKFSVQGAAVVLAPLLLHNYVVVGVPILLPHPVVQD